MTSFLKLPLVEVLQSNLVELGYRVPTLIQSEAIPHLLAGKDLLGIAQTGTGKTASFALPILNKILSTGLTARKGEPLALILAPTRELCTQISSHIQEYAQGTSIRSQAIFGGVQIKDQVSELNDCVEIVVATPGRLLDLVQKKLIRLAKVEMFVLDEADRMLDMGFIDDIELIISELPRKRQNMLFSATMPSEIKDSIYKILIDPIHVEVTKASSTVEVIKQKVIYCKQNHKFQLLKKILKERTSSTTLVFTKTKTSADQVVDYLAQNRLASKAIHGDKEQSERERALDLFKSSSIKVLVATDIASRGIDISGIDLVINFELPLDPESYVHRIGRTGRAGAGGEAVTFCDQAETPILEKIQKLISLYLPSEKFEGTPEVLKFKNLGRKITPPTPGKSQEKSAYLDHSKRQAVPLENEKKRSHPGLKKTKKRRK